MPISAEIANSIRTNVIRLTRFEAGVQVKANKLLGKLAVELDKEIKSLDPTSPKSKNLRTARANKLIKSANETIKLGMNNIQSEVDRELANLSAFEYGDMAKTINKSLQADLISPSITPTQIRSLVSNVVIEGAQSKEWWGRQSASLRNKFSDQVKLGMSRGETVEDIVRRVRGTQQVVQGKKMFVGGIMQESTKNVRSLVRTSFQTVANDSRMLLYQDNADLIKGVQWISTLDGRTSEICIGLDGLQWDLEGNPIGHSEPYPGTTAHWGCRSTQGPVFYSFKELGAKVKGEIPESTRASMGGQVPQSMNYEAWLKQMDKENPGFAKDVLGQKKYDLWKDGKLTLSKMGDGSDRPLSIPVTKPAKISSIDDLASKAGIQVSDLQVPSKIEFGNAYIGDRSLEMYHVTNKSAIKSVLEDGTFKAEAKNQFQGFESRIQGTYGWATEGRAMLELQRMAEGLSDDLAKEIIDDMVVVKIKIPKTEFNKLYPDEDYGLKKAYWRQSYKDLYSVAYKGDLSADHIVEIKR